MQSINKTLYKRQYPFAADQYNGKNGQLFLRVIFQGKKPYAMTQCNTSLRLKIFWAYLFQQKLIEKIKFQG